MENLKRYLNSLSVDKQKEYAKQCGTSVNYLRKNISLGLKFGGALARKLDEFSNGAVPRESLRPDIWPERIRGE